MRRVIIILLLITGCSDGDSNRQGARESDRSSKSFANVKTDQFKHLSPEEIVLTFLNESLKAGASGRSKETYRLLSHRDKDITSENEYLSSVASGASNISETTLSALGKKISKSIKTSIIEGDSATIAVEISTPRLPHNLRKALLDSITPELEANVVSYLESSELQFDANIESYKLVREPDGWKVFLDFGTKKKIEALVDDADALVGSSQMLWPIDGSVLESMKPKLLSAQEKYEKALSLGDDFTAKSHLENVNKQIDKLRFFEQYKHKIEIRNVRVGDTSYSGKGVFGEIKNNGDAILTSVKITIYFLDKNNNAIHEMKYHPVLVTQRSFGDDAVPLKPNYSRQFGVKTDGAPDDWAEKIKVELSDIGVE